MQDDEAVWQNEVRVPMGYSVTVRICDKSKRERVLSFMEKHHKTLKDLFGEGFSDYPHHCQLGKGHLAYDHGKDRVGFDYGPSLMTRDYIYHLIGWLAIYVGDRKTIDILGKGGGGRVMKEMPFYVYDGSEKIAVVRTSEKPDEYPKEFTLWGDDGWTYEPTFEQDLLLGCFPKNYEQVVRAHLKSLTEAWEAAT